VNNAAALGAVAALVFNHELGGNEIVNMGGAPVDIPAGFLARVDGLLLASLDGVTVTIAPTVEGVAIANPYVPADTAYVSTSRGPRGLDASLKPDVAAPAVNIYAAKMGSGNLEHR
jgi:hypothetical protein